MVRHVFFECEFAYSVWMKVLEWIRVKSALSSNPLVNLLHFSRLLKGRRGKLFGVCVWECVVWVLWKARNAKTFGGEQTTREKLLADIKANV